MRALLTAVVEGLDNFQVGMPSVWPREGELVDPGSYALCGTQQNIAVAVGKVVVVECPPTDRQFRYVIVQSLDTGAEKLCLAEVGVFEAGQHSFHSFIHPFIHSYSFINTCQNASTQINAKVNKSL